MTFSRYLLYRLKSSALRTVVLAFISAVIVMFVVVDLNNGGYSSNDSGLYMSAIALGFFATLIPILETACFKNRRNLDTLYCMPIRRSALALVHYLSGFIQVVFIYSVSFFATYIYLAAKGYYGLYFMTVYYLYVLLLGLVLYSIFIFIFSEANTTVDGVILSIGWMLAFWVLMYAVHKFTVALGFSDYTTDQISSWGIIYAPLNNVTDMFQDFIKAHNLPYTAETVATYNFGHPMFNLQWTENLYFTIPWIVLGVGGAAGYFYNMLHKGAENAGEITDSWFGYRLLIPLYGYSCILMIEAFDITTVLVLSAMVIGYIVYRRSFKFKLSDYVVFGVGILLSVFAEITGI